MAAAMLDNGFCKASELPPTTTSREEELEQRIRDLDALVDRQNEALESVREVQQPTSKPRGMALKPVDYEKLMSLLNDLTSQNKRNEDRIEKLTIQVEQLSKDKKQLEEELYHFRTLTKDRFEGLDGWTASYGEYYTGLVKRVKELEDRGKPKDTDVNKAHLDHLASELLIRLRAGQKGATYAEAAKILKIDKSRVCQLRSLIASDSRFNISWHPKRKNTKIICLKNNK